MNGDLYQKTLVDLAHDVSAAGTIDDAEASATRDNPLCGDRVSLTARFDGQGAIAELKHKTRGCLLCEAAAAAVGRHAVGIDAAKARETAVAVRDFLQKGAEAPQGWPEIADFVPVRSRRSRHDCVILAFDALAELAAKGRSR